MGGTSKERVRPPQCRDPSTWSRKASAYGRDSESQSAGTTSVRLHGERTEEVTVPVWAWVLIIVLLVLLLTGGVYVRR